MDFRTLFIANRGEIAIRIARAARTLGLDVAMARASDEDEPHRLSFATSVEVLPGRGARAYLDIEAVVAAARAQGADAVHPGYGFLSESADFAAAVEAADMVFIGPTPETLSLLGDKSAARAAAQACDVPTPRGLEGPVTAAEARAFLEDLGPSGAVMIKAIAGGGGRGARPVEDAGQLETAFATCEAEAKAAFGSGALYVEELVRDARHIEVQIIADGAGDVRHVFERECTLQRSRQKLLEIAPSPSLDNAVRERLYDAARRIARHAGLRGLATFEFLAPAVEPGRFVFIEANPRLQVEHTVTEEIAGIDLVRAQIEISRGARLADLGWPEEAGWAPVGCAMQARLNAEIIEPSGAVRPASGEAHRFEPPTGPGVRIDTAARAGFRPHPAFDSLIAKLIVHERSGDYGELVARMRGALDEFRIAGCDSNLSFLKALLAREDVAANRVDTLYVDRETARLVEEAERFADADDAVQSSAEPARRAAPPTPPGCEAVVAGLSGVVVFAEEEGARLAAGAPVVVVEALKMEHEIAAGAAGAVRALLAQVGEAVSAGDVVAFIELDAEAGAEGAAEEARDLDHIRPDLEEVLQRRAALQDENRPEAVERRRARGKRMARENVAALVDGAFVEYGDFALAAQRSRYEAEELRRRSPADGMIAGVGAVNGDQFTEDKARCAVLAYDYTVFAGTQGAFNHKKKDRLFEIAHRERLPVIMFAEGGGGRPGDADARLGLDITTFEMLGKLKGSAPVLSVVSGNCFAGNAALAACSDLVIATEDASLGMGGPAMIEGGGLGVFRPGEVGPMEMQTRNGVVDLLVKDEIEAADAARRCLSYFQGRTAPGEAADQRLLRSAIPENRLRAYRVRDVVETLFDAGSIIELRPSFGGSVITALARLNGRPVGVVANDPAVLSGAIDADAARKCAEFIGLCDRYGLPVVSLCDTPGFMVGPDAERHGLVREAGRMFVAGAQLRTPLFVVVLRKAYGLGAQAMVGGSFGAPVLAVSWPSGEFGAMGFEGAVRLGYRRELEAIADPKEQARYFDERLAEMYEAGKALTVAEFCEIDAVIDPADTRAILMNAMAAAGPRERSEP